jgi:3-oxoacyl-(acyl-carrier-protein) synthase
LQAIMDSARTITCGDAELMITCGSEEVWVEDTFVMQKEVAVHLIEAHKYLT